MTDAELAQHEYARGLKDAAAELMGLATECPAEENRYRVLRSKCMRLSARLRNKAKRAEEARP